tara:strand:+ start:2241 stop:2543 length:303 start_codon:yes stop_codon:yes gene_type:complete
VDKLEADTVQQLRGDKSSFEITSWTEHYANMIPKHSKDRLVVFKPPTTSKFIGCIRVRDKDNTKSTVWDVVSKDGQYIGLVPAGCQFEAMVVDIKIITPT